MNSNWSYSPERLSWVVTSVTLTFDLWPWPFAWAWPWSLVITPENLMMRRWCEHSQKGDRRTDRRTENTIHRADWSQLKNTVKCVAMNNYEVLYKAVLMSWNRSCTQYLVVRCKYWLVPLIHVSTRVSGYSQVILLHSQNKTKRNKTVCIF